MNYETNASNTVIHIENSSTDEIPPENSLNENNNYERFVKEKFHKFECTYFKRDPNLPTSDIERCYCGETEDSHGRYNESHDNLQDWNQGRCMKSFKPTDFGNITFVENGRTCIYVAKFVRISHNDDVMDLLFKHWIIDKDLDKDFLCISVIGSSNDFGITPGVKGQLKKSLLKAAQTTNTMIITSGLNVGINRVVGDVIRESQINNFDKKKPNIALYCLGISPWCHVMNKEALKNAEGNMVQYKVSNQILHNQPVSLNKNHTHYLFVDGGVLNALAKTKAEDFRVSLERNLEQKNGAKVVLVVVNGGRDVFQRVSQSLRDNIPVVICAGTGGASDILGEAYKALLNVPKSDDGNRYLSNKCISSLKNKLIALNVTANDADETINLVKTIVQNRSLITLFDMKTSEDLDLTILNSLIKKAMSRSATGQSSTYDQIDLCLTWNRVDIAKNCILKANVHLTKEEWNRLFHNAMKNDKIPFIEIFLQNGVDKDEFLKDQTLLDLYNKSDKFTQTTKYYLRETLKKSLDEVGKLLRIMIGRQDIKIYKQQQQQQQQPQQQPQQQQQPHQQQQQQQQQQQEEENRPEREEQEQRRQPEGEDAERQDNEQQRFRRPFLELFICALLTEKYEYSKLFLERCDDQILLCLVATNILMMIGRSLPFQETERLLLLIKWKYFYEGLAIKILGDCREKDKDCTEDIITTKSIICGGLTCLDLANRANDQRFISSMVCQNVIDFTWRSGFKVGFPRCFFAIFFPCLILKSKTYERVNSLESNVDRDDNPHSKLIRFYSAPQTKFWIHFIIHIIFLVYFSAVVLYLMKRKSIIEHEIILMTYLVVMIVDKIIYIFKFQTIFSKSTTLDWWSYSWWNKIDILVIFLSVLAMLLRIPVDSDSETWVYRYRYSKTIYSCIVGYFYLKLLRFIIIHPNLGPKMVMIGQMVRELIIYFVIILIILLAYGVTSQASYYPERIFNASNLSNIIDYPYWTLFGELHLENNVYLNWCPKLTSNSGPTDCPEENYVIPVIYAVYIFVVMILLLNILIAIFANIVNDVEKKSIMVWKFNMYSLMKECESETLLPTPFSIIFYFIELIKFIHGSQCSANIRNNQVGPNGMRTDSMADQNNSENNDRTEDTITEYARNIQLSVIENMYMAATVEKVKVEKDKSMESRILKIENGLHKLSNLVGQVKSKIDSLQPQATGTGGGRPNDNIYVSDQQPLKELKIKMDSIDGSLKSLETVIKTKIK